MVKRFLGLTLLSIFSAMVMVGAYSIGMNILRPISAQPTEIRIGSLVVGSSPWVDIRWYGVKGDGTDEQIKIQAAIDAIPDYNTLLIPFGDFAHSGELDFSAKQGLTIKGVDWGGSILRCTGTNIRSGVSLIGANRIKFQDIQIYNSSSSNSPKAVMVLGRSSGASSQLHRFERVLISGYASQALVYSIASESNSWDSCFFSLIGGGAKYGYYTSNADDLSLGGLTTSTNVTGYMRACIFSDIATTPNHANIKVMLNDSVREHVFRDIIIGNGGSTPGSFVEIESNGMGNSGILTFNNIHGEGSAMQYGFYLKAAVATKDIMGLRITDNTMYLGETGVNFIYQDDNTSLHNSIIRGNRTDTSISLGRVLQSDISHWHSNLTVRSNSSGGNTIDFDDTTYVLSIPLGYNMVYSRGTSKLLNYKDIKIQSHPAIGSAGLVLMNAAGDVTKRVRLNDAGNGLIYEAE